MISDDLDIVLLKSVKAHVCIKHQYSVMTVCCFALF